MKQFKDFILDEACWKGYKQLGMKKKGNKQVPNCVKESVDLRESDNIEITDSKGKTHLFYSTPTAKGKAFYVEKNNGTAKSTTLFLGNDRNVALQRFEHVTKVPLRADQRYIQESSLLGNGMSKASLAADTDQSDREYILAKQQKRKAYALGREDRKNSKPYNNPHEKDSRLHRHYYDGFYGHSRNGFFGISEAQEYSGHGSTSPTVPASFDGTQPFIPDTSATFQISHEGKNWFHGGRVSVNPFSGQRLFQYVQEKQIPGDDDNGPEKAVWADINGTVMGTNYPSQTTAAQGSIEAGGGSE